MKNIYYFALFCDNGTFYIELAKNVEDELSIYKVYDTKLNLVCVDVYSDTLDEDDLFDIISKDLGNREKLWSVATLSEKTWHYIKNN